MNDVKVKNGFTSGISVFNNIVGTAVNFFTLLNTAYFLYLVYFYTVISKNIDKSNIPNDFNGLIYANPVIAICILVAALLLILIATFYIGNGRISAATTARDETLKLMHCDFIHSLRNHMSYLDNVIEPAGDKSGNNQQMLLDYLKNSIQPYVNSLSEFYHKTSGVRISVCVKMFTFDSSDKEIAEKSLVTLVRCKNTQRERTQQKSLAIVGKNTDFEILCTEAGAFYGETDLKSKLTSGLYKSDTDSVDKDYYNSTLVTPIRHVSIALEQPYSGKINIKPRILGFLCIDSKQKMDIWKQDESYALELLGAFADALYIYLNKFYRCVEPN